MSGSKHWFATLLRINRRQGTKQPKLEQWLRCCDLGSAICKLLVGGSEGMSISCPGQRPGLTLEVPRTGTSYVPEYLPESVIQFCDENPYCCAAGDCDGKNSPSAATLHLQFRVCATTASTGNRISIGSRPPEISSGSVPRRSRWSGCQFQGQLDCWRGRSSRPLRRRRWGPNRLAYVPPHLLVHASATPSRREGNRSCCDTLTFAR